MFSRVRKDVTCSVDFQTLKSTWLTDNSGGEIVTQFYVSYTQHFAQYLSMTTELPFLPTNDALLL
jgi:hypothetical protein